MYVYNIHKLFYYNIGEKQQVDNLVTTNVLIIKVIFSDRRIFLLIGLLILKKNTFQFVHNFIS